MIHQAARPKASDDDSSDEESGNDSQSHCSHSGDEEEDNQTSDEDADLSGKDEATLRDVFISEVCSLIVFVFSAVC